MPSSFKKVLMGLGAITAITHGAHEIQERNADQWMAEHPIDKDPDFQKFLAKEIKREIENKETVEENPDLRIRSLLYKFYMEKAQFFDEQAKKLNAKKE